MESKYIREKNLAKHICPKKNRLTGLYEQRTELEFGGNIR